MNEHTPTLENRKIAKLNYLVGYLLGRLEVSMGYEPANRLLIVAIKKADEIYGNETEGETP